MAMAARGDLDAPPAWRDRILSARSAPLGLAAVIAFALGTVMAVTWLTAMPRHQLQSSGVASAAFQYPVRLQLPEVRPAGDEALGRLIEQDAAASPAASAADRDQSPGLDARQDGRRNALAFNQAFRNLEPRPALRPGEFLSVRYDLATLDPTAAKGTQAAGDGGRGLVVTKPLFVDGVSAGAATIRIEEGARILIATQSVATALGSRAQDLPRRISGALAAGSGYIPFQELRGAGIAVEYDPVTDRVSLSLPS